MSFSVNTEFKDGEDPYTLLGGKARVRRPVRCCGCCCACDAGCYFGTCWRTLANVSCLVIVLLAALGAVLGVVLAPTVANTDYELYTGDQAVFCPRSSVFGETVAFEARPVRCNATVGVLKGDLKAPQANDTRRSLVAVPSTWVSAGEHVSVPFHLAPNAVLRWQATAADAPGAEAEEEAAARYLLFRSRGSYERFAAGSKGAADSAVASGTLPTAKQVEYTAPARDEYVLVLWAAARSVAVQADIEVLRTRLAGDFVGNASHAYPQLRAQLDGRCVLLENEWTGENDRCLVVVSVFYDFDEVLYYALLAAAVVGALLLACMWCSTICFCACCTGCCCGRARRRGYSPIGADGKELQYSFE